MLSKEKYKLIIQAGLDILMKQDKHYTQEQIIERLNTKKVKASKSTLSNLKTGKRNVGVNTCRNIALGIQNIIEEESNKKLNLSTNSFIPIENYEEYNSNTDRRNVDFLSTETPFSIGRLGLTEKINLYKTAKHEIIELGVRLRTFSNYFTEESEYSFKNPILQKLEQGVHFHCYMINHRNRFAADYFKDREIVQKGEEDAFREIKKIQDKLVHIFKKLNSLSSKGKMHLHIYDNFPYYHATVIDGKRIFGKIHITQYLYGVSRANSPGFQLQNQFQSDIYEIYWDSIQAIKSRATEIDL